MTKMEILLSPEVGGLEQIQFISEKDKRDTVKLWCLTFIHVLDVRSTKHLVQWMANGRQSLFLQHVSVEYLPCARPHGRCQPQWGVIIRCRPCACGGYLKGERQTQLIFSFMKGASLRTHLTHQWWGQSQGNCRERQPEVWWHCDTVKVWMKFPGSPATGGERSS